MSENPNNPYLFDLHEQTGPNAMIDGGVACLPVVSTGITLRDLFAAAALGGWLAGPCQGDVLDEYDTDPEVFAQHQSAVAKTAYEYADALLAERAKR